MHDLGTAATKLAGGFLGFRQGDATSLFSPLL
jgi:hypothetical protein